VAPLDGPRCFSDGKKFKGGKNDCPRLIEPDAARVGRRAEGSDDSKSTLVTRKVVQQAMEDAAQVPAR
jgi:hypothetical protein